MRGRRPRQVHQPRTVLLAALLVALMVGCTARSSDSPASGGPGRPGVSAPTGQPGGSASSAPVGGSGAPTSGQLLGGPSDPDPLSISSDPAAQAAAQAVEELLDARADALRRQDRPAWAATVDTSHADGGPDAAAELAAYDAMLALGVRNLQIGPVTGIAPSSSGPVPPEAGSAASGPPSVASWSGTVRVGYQLPGFDRGVRAAVRTVTIRQVAGVWRIARWVGPRDAWEAWDLPAMSWARTDSVLVVGSGSVTELADRAAEAQAAYARVSALVGPTPPVVLVVPRSDADAARLLGRQGPVGPSVAAATVGPREPEAPAWADRVILAPHGWQRLLPAGRRVVLTHELVHAAMRGTTMRDVPMWLSEGFAEWVAYRDSGLPVAGIAAALLSDVRDVGPPLGLPEDRAFDPAGSEAVRAYQAGWLAVSRIAREHGPDRLVRFYRAIAGTAALNAAPVGPTAFGWSGPSMPGSTPAPPTGSGDGGSVGVTGASSSGDLARRTESAFLTHLGETRTQFVTNWRAELVELARG